MYKQISNIYATLPAFAADPTDTNESNDAPSVPTKNQAYTSKFRAQALRRVAARNAKAKAKHQEELFLENAITWAEDGHTACAKLDNNNPKRVTIDRDHSKTTPVQPSILQTSKN
jgi:hypothetical protein